MDKKVTVTKGQLMASASLIAIMLSKNNKRKARKMSDILNGFALEAGPKLEENWFVNINLEDYENIQYTGDDDEQNKSN